MKFAGILLVIFLPCLSHSQTISLFAGGGMGIPNGVPATSAALGCLNGIQFDSKGNLFVSSGCNNQIYKVDIHGTVTIIAGTGTAGYLGDNGPATAARLNFPEDLVLDTIGNIFISDLQNAVVRKIDASTSIITTICGNGIAGYSGDNGPATLASLHSPNGICLDRRGNLYIADLSNDVVRKVNSTGIITTFAGNGTYGFSGDGGNATSAQLGSTTVDVVADKSGNIYISDLGNCRIRKVDTFGKISTFAGNGNCTYIGDGMSAIAAQIAPSWIKIDNFDNFFVGGADIINRFFEIDNVGRFRLIAGTGIAGNSGNGGPATDATLHDMLGIAVDSCGDLYISEVDNQDVRKISYPYCNYLDIHDGEFNSEAISVYPNPCADELNINGLTSSADYVIMNITGITEQRGKLKPGSNEVSLKYLPCSLYLLELMDEEGRRTVRKVVKE